MINLEKSVFGNSYFKRVGPYVRLHTIMEDYCAIGLQQAMKGATPETLDEWKLKRNRGSAMHGYIQGIVANENIVVQDEWAKEPIDRFRKWWLKQEHVPGFIERPFVSETYGYGGTVDFFSEDGVLIDWKYAEGVYPDYEIQLAMYSRLLDENGHFVKEMQVVRIPPKSGDEIEVHEVSHDVGLFKAGIGTFQRWKWDNREKLKWACAPQGVIEARKKTRGKNRVKFNNEQHRPEYVWPWL